MARQLDIDSFFLPDGPLTLDQSLLSRLLKPHRESVPDLIALLEVPDLNRPQIASFLSTHATLLPSELTTQLALISELTSANEPVHFRRQLLDAGVAIPERCNVATLAALLVLDAPTIADALSKTLQPGRRRKYSCYYAYPQSIPQMSQLPTECINLIKGDINKQAIADGRTPLVDIVQRPVNRGVRLYLSWGDVLHTTPTVHPGTLHREALAMHPEHTDVLQYDNQYGVLSVRSNLVRDHDIYLRVIGHRVFGDSAMFVNDDPQGFFSVKPMLDGPLPLPFRDVPRISRVVATKIIWTRPGIEDLPYEYSAQVGLGEDGRSVRSVMHRDAHPEGFEVLFEFDDRRTRRVRVDLPNTIVLFDDDDAEPLLDWLRRRGFINGYREATLGQPMRLVYSS
jgi:hypothetical protein